jgi:hypothetical protein
MDDDLLNVQKYIVLIRSLAMLASRSAAARGQWRAGTDRHGGSTVHERALVDGPSGATHKFGCSACVCAAGPVFPHSLSSSLIIVIIIMSSSLHAVA